MVKVKDDFMKNTHKKFFLFYFIIWLSFFFIAINTILPANPIKTPDKLSLITMSIFPQGWGFFSKDPRDDHFYVIDIPSGELGASWPNMTLKNWGGLKRFGRSQGIELGRIYSQVKEQDMVECNETPLQCLEDQGDVINITNDSPSPTITGDVGIVVQESVPWVWAKKVNKEDMPSKIVRLKVDVPDK